MKSNVQYRISPGEHLEYSLDWPTIVLLMSSYAMIVKLNAHQRSFVWNDMLGDKLCNVKVLFWTDFVALSLKVLVEIYLQQLFVVVSRTKIRLVSSGPAPKWRHTCPGNTFRCINQASAQPALSGKFQKDVIRSGGMVSRQRSDVTSERRPIT